MLLYLGIGGHFDCLKELFGGYKDFYEGQWQLTSGYFKRYIYFVQDAFTISYTSIYFLNYLTKLRNLSTAHERTNQRIGRDAISLVRNNSHCKEEVVACVQQKSPWLYPYFYPCPIAFWTSLQLENTSTIEINTDWQPLQIYNPYIFMDLKRQLNWLKSITTKIKEIINETVKHSPK